MDDASDQIKALEQRVEALERQVQFLLKSRKSPTSMQRQIREMRSRMEDDLGYPER